MWQQDVVSQWGNNFDTFPCNSRLEDNHLGHSSDSAVATAAVPASKLFDSLAAAAQPVARSICYWPSSQSTPRPIGPSCQSPPRVTSQRQPLSSTPGKMRKKFQIIIFKLIIIYNLNSTLSLLLLRYTSVYLNIIFNFLSLSLNKNRIFKRQHKNNYCPWGIDLWMGQFLFLWKFFHPFPWGQYT